ncbi:cyclophilin-like fold protein [Pedobacter sp. N23S346]|uniref:cyclophilin-like fold protein n=1 Tax=Pedobacter sp. N23S346 TaxID=3402750 RepID=UPI003ACEDA01
MKHLLMSTMLLGSLCLGMSSCDKDKDAVVATDRENGNTSNPTASKMKITVGAAVFTATLNDNQSANALKAMLPLSIKMEDLNANEKFYNFPGTLPTSASVGGNIQVGDLMLYGNNCLVLFYKGFNTSYSYTRLGKIDNVTGLVAALGSGDVNVRFESQ